MTKRLHDNPVFSDRFLSHMLGRNIRIEEDLVDQLFNSSEKRLARALLLLARYGEQEEAAARPYPTFAGAARGNGRDDPLEGQLLHEQVPQARVHRVQRRAQDRQLAAERRPARLIDDLATDTPVVDRRNDGARG